MKDMSKNTVPLGKMDHAYKEDAVLMIWRDNVQRYVASIFIQIGLKSILFRILTPKIWAYVHIICLFQLDKVIKTMPQT